MASNRTSIYQGTRGADYIEHDCMECGGSFDLKHETLDHCKFCGSDDIVTRRGMNVNHRELRASGDHRWEHDDTTYPCKISDPGFEDDFLATSMWRNT